MRSQAEPGNECFLPRTSSFFLLPSSIGLTSVTSVTSRSRARCRTSFLLQWQKLTNRAIFRAESGLSDTLNVSGSNSRDRIQFLEQISPRTSFHLIVQQRKCHAHIRIERSQQIGSRLSFHPLQFQSRNLLCFQALNFLAQSRGYFINRAARSSLSVK